MPEHSQPLTIFIVDDETLARERLKRMLADMTGEVVGEADNGEKAISGIRQIQPDLVLLDIRMPGIDGLQVAADISKMKPAPAIVFCTAYDEYAIEAFKLNASSYLLKPARKEDLEAAIRSASQLSQAQITQLQASQQQSEPQLSFTAQTWQGLERIKLDDIFYFRADQKYVTVVHKQGETLTDHTLKDIQARFPEQLFRAHRNSLVNILHIHALNRDKQSHYQLELSNGSLVDVSRREVSEAKRLLSRL